MYIYIFKNIHITILYDIWFIMYVDSLTVMPRNACLPHHISQLFHIRLRSLRHNWQGLSRRCLGCWLSTFQLCLGAGRGKQLAGSSIKEATVSIPKTKRVK